MPLRPMPAPPDSTHASHHSNSPQHPPATSIEQIEGTADDMDASEDETVDEDFTVEAAEADGGYISVTAKIPNKFLQDVISIDTTTPSLELVRYVAPINAESISEAASPATTTTPQSAIFGSTSKRSSGARFPLTNMARSHSRVASPSTARIPRAVLTCAADVGVVQQLQGRLEGVQGLQGLQHPRLTSISTFNASSDLYENPHAEETRVLDAMTFNKVIRYHWTELILRNGESDDDEEDGRPFDRMVVCGPRGVQCAYPSTEKDIFFLYAVSRRSRQTNSQGPPRLKTKHDRPGYADTNALYAMYHWDHHGIAEMMSFLHSREHNVDMSDAPEEVYIDFAMMDTMYFNHRMISRVNKRVVGFSDTNDRPAKRVKLNVLPPQPQPVRFEPSRPPPPHVQPVQPIQATPPVIPCPAPSVLTVQPVPLPLPTAPVQQNVSAPSAQTTARAKQNWPEQPLSPIPQIRKRSNEHLVDYSEGTSVKRLETVKPGFARRTGRLYETMPAPPPLHGKRHSNAVFEAKGSLCKRLPTAKTLSVLGKRKSKSKDFDDKGNYKSPSKVVKISYPFQNMGAVHWLKVEQQAKQSGRPRRRI
ncbi:hypothetical protein DDE83_007404 [Stemphylium lycopersici]|uniref:Uncharacterized protein n=1 Tax=Stemphylium lycopersici TaxID=183478 RepID=A0A364MW58_STELY|nr:hypothetical protein DDE83_007404 [Stemphylium lycopersici]